MLLNQLESEIYTYSYVIMREPKIIVVNPKTWFEFIQENTDSYYYYYCRNMCENNNNNMEYKGIKVYRSQDITEGKFEVY